MTNAVQELDTRVKYRTKDANRRPTILCGAMILLTLIAGCGDNKHSQTPEDKLAAGVPQSFDPCHGIPDEILSGSKLLSHPHPISDNGTKVKSQGCDYTMSNDGDGSDLDVMVTNMTYDYFRDVYVKRFGNGPVKEISINQRPSITHGPEADKTCTLFISIKGGGLKFDTLTPKGDPCQNLINFADKVLPILPPGA
ncbi:hypothetical protein ABIA39_000307 [Nocardia sp. GAS34]|uniref:DUF3558 family protein n=1 Tax=unclassified Nocardia TaxID=2637762 RepID=UPI003D1A138D